MTGRARGEKLPRAKAGRAAELKALRKELRQEEITYEHLIIGEVASGSRDPGRTPSEARLADLKQKIADITVASPMARWVEETQMYQRVAGTPESPTAVLEAEWLKNEESKKFFREQRLARKHNHPGGDLGLIAEAILGKPPTS